jgi:heme-degrading monooxygenase HmoA
MICRIWRGWTNRENAEAYERYLTAELFPRVRSELAGVGYRGHQVLRTERAGEIEFVTLVWFESLEAVRSFAGEAYQTPVITEKARGLLARWQEWCDHYEVRGLDVTAVDTAYSTPSRPTTRSD